MPIIEELNQMENAIGQKISTHLEFLGYDIEDKTTSGRCEFLASPKDHLNPRLNFTVYKNDLVSIEV